MCGVSPGKRWKSPMNTLRAAWLVPSSSIRASSAAIATAMSEGWVAMQASLAPRIACPRLMPPTAAHPEPGVRLLHAAAVS